MKKDKVDLLLSRTGDMALRRRAKLILQAVLKKNPSTILDAGCGDGFYLHLLSQLLPNSRITGVDDDPKALISARRNIKSGKIKLIRSDLANLRLPKSSFELILLSEVLEHVVRDDQTLKILYELLEPNGEIIISVPHVSYPFLWDPINWLLERLFKTHIRSGFFAGIWNQHERLYSKPQLANLLKQSGFKEINTVVLTRYCLPFNHYLLNLAARVIVNNRQLTQAVNKFNMDPESRRINPFWLILLFDKLNDPLKTTSVGVSLVAIARKI